MGSRQAFQRSKMLRTLGYRYELSEWLRPIAAVRSRRDRVAKDYR